MKINTQVQLLIAFFKESLLRVNPNINGTATVSQILNHRFITKLSELQMWLNSVNFPCLREPLMKHSINLSHQAQSMRLVICN